MLGCGKGYNNVSGSQVPGLQDFLSLKVNSFSCANIPENVKLSEPMLWQQFYPYYLKSVGLLWQKTGVSWSALWPFYGVSFAAGLLAIYALYRVAMGWGLALVFAAVTMSSLPWETIFPSLKYYLKAPFIVACFAIILYVVTRPPKSWGLVAASAALGAVIGFGIGFRTDVLICLPVSILILLFCQPGNVFKNLKYSVPAVAVLIGVAALAALPVLPVLFKASNAGHVLVMGLGTNFTDQLRIAPTYFDWGPLYNDSLTRYIINAYTQNVLTDTKLYFLHAVEYENAGIKYFFELLTHFPADIILRPLAAAFYIADGAVRHVIGGVDTTTTGALMGFFFVGLSITVVAYRNIRAAIILMLLALFFGGYSAILFRIHDSFHINVVIFLAMGFLIHIAFSTVSKIIRETVSPTQEEEDGAWRTARRKRAFVFAIVASIGIFGGLWVLRGYQNLRLEVLFDTYDTAPIEELTVEKSWVEKGFYYVDAFAFSNTMAEETRNFPLESKYLANYSRSPIIHEYVVAKLDAKACGQDPVNVTFLYKGITPYNEYSRTIKVAFTKFSKTAKAFFPAFYHFPHTKFRGIKLPVAQADCLKGIYRIKQDAALPVSLYMALTDDWRNQRRYMKLR